MNPNDLEQRIAAIEQRNVRVEADKAWEVSWERRVVVAVVTYFVTDAAFRYGDVTQPWLAGILASLGYIVSTFTMPVIRSHWVKHLLEKRKPKNVTIH